MNLLSRRERASSPTLLRVAVVFSPITFHPRYILGLHVYGVVYKDFNNNSLLKKCLLTQQRRAGR